MIDYWGEWWVLEMRNLIYSFITYFIYIYIVFRFFFKTWVNCVKNHHVQTELQIKHHF